jgi:hypothetical protein
MDRSSQILLLIFVAIAACSIFAQAIFALGLFLGARKAQKKLMSLAEDIRLHALPVIISSREVIQDLTPKLKTISENLTEISTMLRAKSAKVGMLVEDVTDRAQVQATRVDGMVKVTLDQVTYAVQAIEHGIAKPVRQVNGILNGLRAGVDVLRKKEGVRSDSGDDLFV